MTNKNNGKASAGEGEEAVVTPTQLFYIPELDRTIEAVSIEEAVEKANQELNK